MHNIIWLLYNKKSEKQAKNFCDSTSTCKFHGIWSFHDIFYYRTKYFLITIDTIATASASNWLHGRVSVKTTHHTNKNVQKYYLKNEDTGVRDKHNNNNTILFYAQVWLTYYPFCFLYYINGGI
jgi:hypothetical protein